MPHPLVPVPLPPLSVVHDVNHVNQLDAFIRRPLRRTRRRADVRALDLAPSGR